MAFLDYWSLLCPLAIEKGFNVSLNPNMTDNPGYLSFYVHEDDPVYFQPAFNCPEDFGEPGPHIALRLLDERKKVKDYLRYVLQNISTEPGAEKTTIAAPTSFKAYIWKPMAYDLSITDWAKIPRDSIDEWLNWHLHYLQEVRKVFFHEGV